MAPPAPNVPVSEGTVGLAPSPERPWGIINTAQVVGGLYGAITGPGSFIDTLPARVPFGQSCVEAAEHRAQVVANQIRSLQSTGGIPPGYSATVGTVSGYSIPGIGSVHTYTVVEIKNSTGNVVKTIEVDNYLGVPVINPFHSTVNWNDPYNNATQKIPARK
jgi:hypothetical protein